MAGEQLHVAQRAASLMDQARRLRDKGPTTGMRRTAVQADGAKGPRKPQHDTTRPHAPAALRRDDGPGAYGYRSPGAESLPQFRVNWDAASRPFLGGVITQLDAGGKVAIPAEHHVPGETGNLSRPQRGLDRQQDDEPIPMRVAGRTRVVSRRSA